MHIASTNYNNVYNASQLPAAYKEPKLGTKYSVPGTRVKNAACYIDCSLHGRHFY